MSPLRVSGQSAYPATVASARVRVARLAPHLAPHGVALEHVAQLSADEHATLTSSATSARRRAGVLAAASARGGPRAAAAARAVRADGGLLLVHRLRLLAPLPGFDPPRDLDVYDLDDALHLGSASAANRRFGLVKQEARRAVACLRAARLVLAGNAHLAGSAARWATGRVEVVPSLVDPDAQPLRAHADAEELVVGWIGSPSTSPYLRAVLPALARARERGLALRVVLVGADATDPELDAPWIAHVAWSEQEEAAQLARFDVGIMPLPDDAWARGKCAYKLLRCFAAGVPVIASPVGVAAGLVEDGRGIAARDGAGWEAALHELAADGAAGRAQRGARARAHVEERFSYAAWAPRIAGLLHETAAAR